MVSVERCTHVPSEPKKAQEGALMMGPVPVRHQHKVISFQCLPLVPSNVGGDEATVTCLTSATHISLKYGTASCQTEE